MKEEIIKIITENTEHWQPCGKENSCFIIEEEGFLWKINKLWAEEIAEKIMKLIND